MAFKALETKGLGPGSLKAVEVGVTSRCNFRCSYCGAYDLREKQILSIEELAATLEQLPDLERVKLSGGEVLLEFDICEGIVRWCSERGIDTQINSNGTLLDEERFRRLEDAGLGVLHFSLNHTDAQSHAQFYGVNERMFPKIIGAISRACTSPSIECVAETILFNETQDSMAAINRFAAELGVRKHEIQMEIPSIHQGYENTLSHDELCDSIIGLIEGKDPRTTLYFSCLSAYFVPSSPAWTQLGPLFSRPGVIYSSCIEGKAQLHLHSNGDVLICELGCPEVIGNVFEKDLLAIYSESERLQEFVKSKHDEQTFTCYRHFDTPGQKSESESQPVQLLTRKPGAPR